MVRLRYFVATVGALFVLSILMPSVAAAQDSCDGGALCSDNDKDGFVACGCPWAGSPCDCDDNDPATFPRAPEACNAQKDFNCNGVVPDRCPTKRGCLDGVCVPECIPLDDFGCAVGSTFSSQPNGKCLCAPRDCTLFGCPPGSTCDDSKTCVPSCHPGVRCPYGQRCRGSGCADPCADVTCPDGGACNDGLCVPSCTCCPSGQTCDVTAGAATCIESACVGARCPDGAHCEHGTCTDDCAGVVCPPNRVCRLVSLNGKPAHGSCVDLCSPSPCKSSYTCDWRTGHCTLRPAAEGGLETPDSLDGSLEIAGAGWLCSASGLARASAVTAVAGVGGLVVLVIRRRRRRTGTNARTR